MPKIQEPGAINDRLKYLRETEGLTQQEFCDRLNKHRQEVGRTSPVALSTVGNYETISPPKPYYLAAVLKAFPGLSPDWLMLGVGSQYRSEVYREAFLRDWEELGIAPPARDFGEAENPTAPGRTSEHGLVLQETVAGLPGANLLLTLHGLGDLEYETKDQLLRLVGRAIGQYRGAPPSERSSEGLPLMGDIADVLTLPFRYPRYFAAREDLCSGELDTYALALVNALRPLVRSVRGQPLGGEK